MNRTILNRLRQAIRLNLEDKAGQIIKSYGSYLSKRDLTRLIEYMIKIKSYSYGVIRYIFYVSPHRHVFNPVEHNKLLCYTYGYPAIIDLLWSDDRVVQEYLRIEELDAYAHSNIDAHYAARYVLSYGTSRSSMRFLIDKIRSPYILSYALERAADHGYTDIVAYLFERYSSVLDEQSCNYALRVASSGGFDSIVSILLKSGAKVDQYTLDHAMRGACFGGKIGGDTNLKTVRLLLEDLRSDPANRSNNSIYYACTARNPEPGIVMLLLQDERVDPRKCNTHPIRSAEKFGIIRILLEDKRYDTELCIWKIRNLIWRDNDKNEYEKITRLLLTNESVRAKLKQIQRSDLEQIIKLAEDRYPNIASVLAGVQNEKY